MTPLIKQKKMEPVLDFIKYKGWIVLMLLFTIIRGFHGLPEAVKVLFVLDKNDLLNYTPHYSKHDMWVVHSGMWSFFSSIVLIFLITSFIIQLVRNSNKYDKT